MNDPNHQALIRAITKSRFHGKTTIDCRTLPRYPATAEREYMRLSRRFMRQLKDALQKRMPDIVAAYKQERLDARLDSSFRFTEEIRRIMQEIASDLEQQIGDFGLEQQISRIAEIANAISVNEWKRAVKNTLGIDILQDYYKGETYAEALKLWAADNVLRIKSIPNDTLGNLEKIILEGFQKGKTVRQLREEIQDSYDMDKRHAELLARDQVSTLNAQVSKMQQTDAGVRKYRWSDSKDSRVRPCHAALDGQVFSWDDPPEMWYETKGGTVYTGRRCHPGEDYACRCVAIPIFDWHTVDVPIRDSN